MAAGVCRMRAATRALVPTRLLMSAVAMVTEMLLGVLAEAARFIPVA